MSCWRVLELSEQPDGEQIPQLLVKPVFGREYYTVHLTCLSNIWSEELDLAGIVDRAAKEQSPIEVGKQDTAQLAILLDNVKKSLEHSDDAICRITRTDNDGVTLHTTIALPRPLDSLTWKFHLEKRASTVLKNELILPLLVSSHIQHERISGLVSTINDKDKAITRLVDQYESSNLDLAAAFPIVSGLKTGRKVVKREQAARHVPALQPFREDAFKQETGHLVDLNVSTLDLFQEALSECTPAVPWKLQSEDTNVTWWNDIPTHVSRIKTPVKSKAAAAEPTKNDADFSGEETEDEFETHSNFKTRNLPFKAPRTAVLSPPLKVDTTTPSDDEATEDDDDLDAPPKGQSQILSQAAGRPAPSRLESSTPEVPSSPPPNAPSVAKSKAKGFRIGGKTRQVARDPSPPPQEDVDTTPDADELPIEEPQSSQMTADVDATPKKAKRTFKIGGKGRGGMDGSSQVLDTSASLIANRTRATQSPSVQPPSSPPPPKRETTPIVEEEREETAEEKAERRRAELKRKTEEAAKKQAQSKKKRRF